MVVRIGGKSVIMFIFPSRDMTGGSFVDFPAIPVKKQVATGIIPLPYAEFGLSVDGMRDKLKVDSHLCDSGGSIRFQIK